MDAIRHDAGKTTPTQNSKSSKEKYQDDMRQDAAKPAPSVTTPIVPTPTQESTKSGGEPGKAMQQDVGKPKPSIATPIVAPPTQEKFSVEERREAIRNDAGKPTPNV
jgi:hypothetical protein